MTQEEFAQLQKKAEEDLVCDKVVVQDKCRDVPSIYQRWLNVFNKESRIYADLVRKQKALYGALYKELRFKSNYAWTEEGIKSQIATDTRWIEVALEVDRQKHVVDYLQATLDNINRLGFSIKSYIDLLKYQGGLGL